MAWILLVLSVLLMYNIVYDAIVEKTHSDEKDKIEVKEVKEVKIYALKTAADYFVTSLSIGLLVLVILMSIWGRITYTFYLLLIGFPMMLNYFNNSIKASTSLTAILSGKNNRNELTAKEKKDFYIVCGWLMLLMALFMLLWISG